MADEAETPAETPIADQQAQAAIEGAGFEPADIAAATDLGLPPTTEDRDARLQSVELTLVRLFDWAARMVEHLGGPNKAPPL